MRPLDLAAVLIVKNEERCLDRCLRSVAKVVDRVVVVDTGSTDNTIAIAKRHGALIGHFEWCDDFAAARNAALDLADADWNLILDADEWIDEGAAALESLRTEARRHVWLTKVREYDESGRPVSQSDSVRVLPRGIRYEHRIHEQPVHDLLAWRSPLVLGHDGYGDSVLATKQGRNRRLLESEVATHPDDAYRSFKLAEELRRSGEYARAVKLFDTAYRRGGDGAPWRHAAVLGFVGCLADDHQFQRALGVVEEEMGRWSDSPDFFFVLGNLLLDFAVAEPARGAGLLPMIENAYLRCLEIGDRPDLDGSQLGHGSFLAAKNLGAYYQSLGDEGRARQMADLEATLRRRETDLTR